MQDTRLIIIYCILAVTMDSSLALRRIKRTPLANESKLPEDFVRLKNENAAVDIKADTENQPNAKVSQVGLSELHKTNNKQGISQTSALSSDNTKNKATLSFILGDHEQKRHERLLGNTGSESEFGGSGNILFIGGSIAGGNIQPSAAARNAHNYRNTKQIAEMTKNKNGDNKDKASNDSKIKLKDENVNINNDKKKIIHSNKTGGDIDFDNLTENNNKINNNNQLNGNNSHEDNNSKPDAIKNQNQSTVATSANNKDQPPKLHDHEHEKAQPGRLSGKFTPADNVLKFANMLLYKVGLDSVPFHAQGTQISINPNGLMTYNAYPNENEDLDAIDYIYNTLDPGAAAATAVRTFGTSAGSPVKPSTSVGFSGLPGTVFGRSYPPQFMFPTQYSAAVNEPNLPLNFIESALDTLLSNDDEGEDEVELRCPIHHDNTKSLTTDVGNTGSGTGDTKNDVVQVCSCRFFKKRKNA